MAKHDPGETLSDAEATKRMNAAVKRAMEMKPKPYKKRERKRGVKKATSSP